MKMITKRTLVLREREIVVVTFERIRSVRDIREILTRLGEKQYTISDFGVVPTVETAGIRPPERFRRAEPMLAYLETELKALPFEISFSFKSRTDRGEGKLRPLSDGLFLETPAY